jgi:hypothetical protein
MITENGGKQEKSGYMKSISDFFMGSTLRFCLRFLAKEYENVSEEELKKLPKLSLFKLLFSPRQFWPE